MISLRKFLAKFKSPVSLPDLLKEKHLRESLLNVNRMEVVNEEKNKNDAARIVNYSRSEDYEVYAQELWKTVCHQIQRLCDEDLKEDQVQFLRGALSSNLDALKISFNASKFLERREEASIRPPLGVIKGR